VRSGEGDLPELAVRTVDGNGVPMTSQPSGEGF
jgi:hypothetical protein